MSRYCGAGWRVGESTERPDSGQGLSGSKGWALKSSLVEKATSLWFSLPGIFFLPFSSGLERFH